MSCVRKNYLYVIIFFNFFILDHHLYHTLAQDSIYALNVNTANCVADPNNPESNLLYGGALSSSLVMEDTVLLSQPPLTPDTDPLEIVMIPVNARVIVFDVDEQTESYFRVAFLCEGYNLVGWVEASAIRHRVNHTNPKYAPTGCARPLQVLTSLNDEWTSTLDGEIAVVVDLFRAEGGTEFPRSYFYLTNNGREIRDKERAFETSGSFLIRSLTLSTEVKIGDAIGFSVLTDSNEELEFFSILYFVTEECPLLPYGLFYYWGNLASEFVVVDEHELLGEVFKEQTGNIDNSTGTVLFSQDITLRREFRHSIDLRLNEGANLDRQNVEQRILETYDLPDQVGERNCIILADVPAGAIHQYDIEWTQVLREGNIEEGSVPGQGNILGTYSIIFDLQCQRVGVSIVQ